jgi:ribonucleotide monophosphatase NagD (HAD superfamily)
MCRVLEESFPIRPGRTLLVGDSITSDVVTGNKLGLDTGLVLGGTSSRDELQDASGLEVPDLVFREFDRLLRKL